MGGTQEKEPFERDSGSRKKSTGQASPAMGKAHALSEPLVLLLLWVQSLVSLSGLRIQHCCGCGVGW